MHDIEERDKVTTDIDKQVRQYCSKVINDTQGLYVNPEFVTKNHVATVVAILSRESDADIAAGPLAYTVQFINEHEHMPPKIEWAARLDVRGVEDPLWASKMEGYGPDIEARKPYWLTDRWQETECDD